MSNPRSRANPAERNICLPLNTNRFERKKPANCRPSHLQLNMSGWELTTSIPPAAQKLPGGPKDCPMPLRRNLNENEYDRPLAECATQNLRLESRLVPILRK